jgi:hypothetical protein
MFLIERRRGVVESQSRREEVSRRLAQQSALPSTSLIATKPANRSMGGGREHVQRGGARDESRYLSGC